VTPAVDAARTSEQPLRSEVDAALETIKSRLRGHGGDVVVGDITDGVVDLEFRGACRGCPAQGFTLISVVEPAVMSVPTVTKVKSSRSHLSPFVVDRIRRMSPPAVARTRDHQHPDRT
jgi:Fe-S cluster biogenesis protein NfuA